METSIAKKPTPRELRLADACQRVIGLCRQGIDLRSAVIDTSMKSEFTVEELAAPISRLLDAAIAARKAVKA